MRLFLRALQVVAVGTVLIGSVACDSSTSPNSTLTIRGSAAAPPAATPALLARLSLSPRFYTGPELVVGDPSRVKIKLYALYISEHADCSAPKLVTSYGDAGAVKEFTQNPVLFAGTPPSGTYSCLMMRMSDVIHFESKTASTNCHLNTDYAIDIYRAPDTDWRTATLDTIVATGTDSVPSDDKVFIFATTDRAAAEARGISPHQTLKLKNAFTIPMTATFYWNAQGTVTDAADACGMQPPELAFM